MLNLGRRQGESIVIHVPGCEPITVTVRELRGNQVRLGFTAPHEVIIIRQELLERKDMEHGRDTRVLPQNPGNQAGQPGAIRDGNVAATGRKGKPPSR